MRQRSFTRSAAADLVGDLDLEPRFEPPPQLSARPERRLTTRAAAGFAASELGRECRPNAVTLDLADRAGVTVLVVGSSIAAMFGLAAGRLVAPPVTADGEGRTLSALLCDACAVLRARRAPLPFEGVVATTREACVMLRGVLLPIGRGGRAEAVLSWKQVLDADATARLRAELVGAFRARATLAPPDAFAVHATRPPECRKPLALPL